MNWMILGSEKSTNDWRTLLDYVLVIVLSLGMFYWEPSFYAMFWYRRLFIYLAGALALLSLVIFYPRTLQKFRHNKLLGFYIILSALFLSFTSPLLWLLSGHPMVHPSLSSLLAAIMIGLWLTTQNTRKVLAYLYHGLVVCSVILCGHWLLSGVDKRLGYLDSQVIYAACLLGLGVLLASWHYRQQTLPRTYLRISGAFLLVCLLLTQTRSALVLVAICLFATWRTHLRRKHYAWLVAGSIVLVAGLGLYFSRLHDTRYFIESVKYRASLSAASLPANKSELLLGGGIGSIEQNISQNGLNYQELRGDLGGGIKFESSHNYLVDVLVERGVLALIIFVTLVVQALGAKPRDDIQTFARLTVLFMGSYVAVNNINIQMEVILWAGLVYCLFARDSKTRLTVRRPGLRHGQSVGHRLPGRG